MREAGFGAVVQVDDEALRHRYLQGWPDAPLTGIERLAVATV